MSNDPILAMIAEHRRVNRMLKRTKTDDDNSLLEFYLDVSERLFRTTQPILKSIREVLVAWPQAGDIGHGRKLGT